MNLNDLTLKKDTRQKENTQVLNKIVKFLKENTNEDEIEIFKNWGSGLGKSGRPDLEIVYNGRTWYIETKDPNGEVSTIQNLRIERLKRAGVPVYIIDNKERFISEVWVDMNKKEK